MIKKIFSILCAVVVVAQVSPLVVSADVQPQVVVRDIHLANTTYTAGDTVTGTFTLTNETPSINIPNVTYQISLVGDYAKNGLPQTYFDTKSYGPVFLGATQKSQQVSFNYVLPKTFSGSKLGIHIRAFLSTGAPLGWSDAPIVATGGLTPVLVTNGILSVDVIKYASTSQPFSLMSGPTIYKGKQGSLIATLVNTSKDALTLTPHVIVHNRSLTGAVLTSSDAPSFTLTPNKSQKVVIPLDTFNYTPGVYLGELTFNDAQGNARTTELQFRYIVAGDIVTITSVTSPSSSINKGQPLNLLVNYAGTPYDIFATDSGITGVKQATLDVKVYNEKDQLVGDSSQIVDFSSGSSKTVSLTAAVDAKALRADVTVSNAGKTLTSYSTKLSPNYDKAHAQANSTNSGSYTTVYVTIAIVFFILGLIVLMVTKNKNMRKKIKLLVIAALVIGTTVGVIFSSQKHVSAFTITSTGDVGAVWDYVSGPPWMQYSPGVFDPSQGNGNQEYSTSNGDIYAGYHPFGGSTFPFYHYASSPSTMAPDVVINSPSDSDTVAPGDQFYLTGSTYALACDNNPQDILVTVTFNGQTLSQRYNNVNNYDVSQADHTMKNSPTVDFSIGPFTAPSTPGSYEIDFRVDNYTNVPGQAANEAAYQAASQKATPVTPATTGGDAEGYQMLNVQDQGTAPSVILSADQNYVNTGTGTTLRWTTSDNPTSCIASNGWSGSKATAGGSQATGNLSNTTTYTITCSNAYGSNSDSVTVTVGPDASASPQAPVVELFANPGTVTPSNDPSTNYKTYLTWNSNNATSCSSNDFTVPNHITNESSPGVAVGPLHAPGPYTYTITCTNGYGSADSSVTVDVANTVTASCEPSLTGEQPTGNDVNTTVNKSITWTAVTSGPVSSITWSGDEISGSPTGSTLTQSYSSVGKKTASITVTSTDGSSQTVSCSANVNVKPNPIFQEF